MTFSSRFVQIIVALILSGVLVVGAYYLARSTAHPPSAQASTETALLQSIATKDTDGDGLPDWEESLYGTDANVVDTKKLGMSDGEAVAKGLIIPKASAAISSTSTSTDSIGDLPTPAEGSLTDIFAKNFFALYLVAKQKSNTPLTQNQISALAAQAIDQLSRSVSPTAEFRTASQIEVAGSGPQDLITYAGAAEEVLAVHGSHVPKNELEYLQDALTGDTGALKNIQIIATAYRDTAEGLSALTVPKEIAADHLALVNAMARIGAISIDFSKLESDPLTTMLALKQYGVAVQNLSLAFSNIHTLFDTERIALKSGTKGAVFVNMVVDVAAKQKEKTTHPL